jgi:hypothetical protein
MGYPGEESLASMGRMHRTEENPGFQLKLAMQAPLTGPLVRDGEREQRRGD